MSDEISTAKIIALIKALAGGGGGGDAHGIPSGGTTGQIIKKTSGTDYAVAWANNTLGGLSDVDASSSYPDDMLTVGASGDWERHSPDVGLGACEDDGGGNIVWDYDLSVNENDPANMSPLWRKIMYDIETGHDLTFLWRTVEYDGDENEVKKTYYFIDHVASTPFAPSIKRFVTELVSDEWTPATLQTSPAVAHEVARQWVGTAAEYAALSPDYDANTLYYIKEA